MRHDDKSNPRGVAPHYLEVSQTLLRCGLRPPDAPYAFRAQTGMEAPVQQVSTPGSSPPVSKDGVLRLRILRDWILNPANYCPAQRGLEALEVGGSIHVRT